MTPKLTEEQRHAHQRISDAKWKSKNQDKVRGYRAKWKAKRKAERLAEAGDSTRNPERQKAAALRLLAKAAAIAKAKTNGRGMSGELKVRGI